MPSLYISLAIPMMASGLTRTSPEGGTKNISAPTWSTGILISLPVSSFISSSRNLTASRSATGGAPSVLPVLREMLMTSLRRLGVRPMLSRIDRALRVMTELSMPKGQKIAQRRQSVQE